MSPSQGRSRSVQHLLSELRWHLNKPYYLFRPRQLISRGRVRLEPERSAEPFTEVVLPWGLPLRIRRDEVSGVAILRRGLFDLVVSEVLYRLSDPGELAVDVGANVGHMTSLFAKRLGPDGKVISFEPHPTLFSELSSNVSRWKATPGTAAVSLQQVALSDETGEGELGLPDGFARNRGSAAIRGEPEEGGSTARSERVALQRLDDVMADRAIGVMKVDVEGHELGVFRGAERLLSEHRVRDIVFEEFERPPTAVTTYLEGLGYRVFALDQSLAGPLVGPARDGAAVKSRDDPSYLATSDSSRALRRLRRRGWAALGMGRVVCGGSPHNPDR